MNATELRIGNYLFDRENNLCKVKELGVNSIYAPAKLGCSTKIPNKPIPLSAEVLLQFGFINGTCGYELIIPEKRARLSVILRKDLKKQMVGIVGIAGPFGLYDTIHYKYVHQLQNLYFALCGEELIF